MEEIPEEFQLTDEWAKAKEALEQGEATLVSHDVDMSFLEKES